MQSACRLLMPLRRLAAIVLFVTLAVYPSGPEVQASGRCDIQISSEVLSVRPGKTVVLTVAVSGDSTVSVAGCYMEIALEPSVFTLRRLSPLGGVTAGELDYEQTDGVLRILYCDGDGGTSPIVPGQPGMLRLEFTADEKAVEGKYLFRLLSGDFTDTNKNTVAGFTPSDISIEVLPPLSDDASLGLIDVPGFTLHPSFSPDITDYAMEVPSTVSTLAFLVKTNDAGANYKINRTTLKAAGSDTEITVTVTAEDARTKEVYTVLVSRAPKASVDEPVITSKPAAAKASANQPTTSSKPAVGKPVASKPPAQPEDKRQTSGSAPDEYSQNTKAADTAQVQPLLTERGNSFATFFIGMGGGLLILLFYLVLKKKDG